MTFHILKPMLRTWNLQETINFYTVSLEFQCEARSDPWGWAHLQRDGVAIVLSSPNQHEDDVALAFTGSLYITRSDVDQLWERLRDRVRIGYPLEDFEYGMREFGIYDNNGYLLQFGTPLANWSDVGRSPEAP